MNPQDDVRACRELAQLETVLKVKANNKFRFMIFFICATVALLLLGLGLHALAFDKFGTVLFIAWGALFAYFLIAARPFLSPRCPQCQKRMEKAIIPTPYMEDRIYFVCHACKVKAYSQCAYITS